MTHKTYWVPGLEVGDKGFSSGRGPDAFARDLDETYDRIAENGHEIVDKLKADIPIDSEKGRHVGQVFFFITQPVERPAAPDS